MNIFLIGFMGVGKSTIASKLGSEYQMEIVEMDELLVKRNNMSISDIFEKHGEAYFRQLETDLLKEMKEKTDVVVSCGGGVPLREINVEIMRESGKIVWLTAKPETIYHRVKNNHDRPLLENNKNVDFIKNMMESRRPKYEAAADIIVYTDNKKAKDICKEIMDQIEG